MQYSNTDFVLLGEIAARITGRSIGDLIVERVVAPLGLARTTYQFDDPPDLMPGFYELGGTLLDMSVVPQQSILSIAGAAGALHSDVRDMLLFVRELLTGERVVSRSSVALMTSAAEPGSWYGHALMRFCPCTNGPDGLVYEGYGHGGNLPGYWSMVAYFPADDLAVAVVLDRDVVDGVALQREDVMALVTETIETVRDHRVP